VPNIFSHFLSKFKAKSHLKQIYSFRLRSLNLVTYLTTKLLSSCQSLNLDPEGGPMSLTIDAFLGIDIFFWYLWNPASGESKNSFPIAWLFWVTQKRKWSFPNLTNELIKNYSSFFLTFQFQVDSDLDSRRC